MIESMLWSSSVIMFTSCCSVQIGEYMVMDTIDDKVTACQCHDLCHLVSWWLLSVMTRLVPSTA